MTGSGRTATMLALGAIVALGAVLRAWGIGYGLPHTLTRPDEEMVAARALAMLQTGRLDPVTFFYPSLFVYLDAAALRAWLAVGVWLGRYRGLDDFLVGMLRGPLVHFLLARALSAAFGTGTVVVAYFLGRRAGSGRPAGLLAALAVATCYLHARDAHFAKADVLMGFFVALALLFAARAAEGGRLRDFAWGGPWWRRPPSAWAASRWPPSCARCARPAPCPSPPSWPPRPTCWCGEGPSGPRWGTTPSSSIPAAGRWRCGSTRG
jgi:4-amino-4-deoxy-L-arabinose transferase-like glycosyltransferase